MTTKVCSKCKVEKDLGEFYKNSSKKDGLCDRCKSCNASYMADYYAKNSEKIKAREAKRYVENPEKFKAYQAKYIAENPEKIKARNAKYYAENPEKVKAYQAKYQAENPEKVKAWKAKYRTKNPEKIKAYTAKRNLDLGESLVRNWLKVPNPPQELIELKRLQLQLIREIKQQGK